MKHVSTINGQNRTFFTNKDDFHATIPLVLLHGFCEDASLWEPVLPLLSDGPVLRIDLPGFGGSDLPPAPGMEVYADAVCAILHELGITRCVLAGHSMGGYVALAFARAYPERLAGYTLVHSHPYPDTPERIENRRRGIEMLQAGKKDLYVAQLFPGLFAPAFAQTRPEVVDALVQTGQTQPTEGIIAALQGMIDRQNHLDTLRDSTCPVQFILGELDAIVPLEDALAAATIPSTVDIRVLSGVGHMGIWEAPQHTASALRDFWKFCAQQPVPEHSNKTQTAA
ncbi:MAG: alpha/beta hydrolase [Lewinellaceae bacterium]|nr:alpha/beta hydrolase [Lewinellaceae bacterium]